MPTAKPLAPAFAGCIDYLAFIQKIRTRLQGLDGIGDFGHVATAEDPRIGRFTPRKMAGCFNLPSALGPAGQQDGVVR